MRPIFFFAVIAVSMGCAHRPQTSSTSAPCELAGAAPLLQAGHTLVLGEMHGTRESSETVGTLACQASRTLPVLVGLEISSEAAPHLTGYFNGTETPQTALGDPFWQDAYQDGRRSEAMFALITQLRALKAEGARVELLLFDDLGNQNPEARDEKMAAHILEGQAAHADAVTVVLVGNLHARKKIGAPWKPDYVWMAHHLDGKLPLTTLDVRYASGSAWICRGNEASSCGADFIGGKSTAPKGIALNPTPDGNYDGTFAVGALHASSPAARPVQIGDLSHSDGALRFQGSQAYASKDFALCARLFGQVAKPNQSDAWNSAGCLARAGQADQAFVQIAAARALGAKLDELRADEDFASLKGDSRWDGL